MSEKISYSWHEKTWKQFSNAYTQDHLPHAILVSGGFGVGKQAFSDRMSKLLLCVNTDSNSANLQACGQCRGCKTYESGANPDYLKIQLLEDKQQIGVDQIRQITKFLTLSRSFNGYRVVLINQIEKMNQNAANSLLKSLEEPTDKTVIILTTPHLSKIIPTIISRSQLLSLPLPSKNEAINWIKTNAPDINLNNIDEILEISGGSPLLAIKFDAEALNQRADFAKDIVNIIDKNSSITDIAKKWEKHDQTILLDWQIIWLQNLLKKTSIPTAGATILSSEKLKNVNSNMLWVLYQNLLEKKQIIHTSVNPLINLESMLSLWLQAIPYE